MLADTAIVVVAAIVTMISITSIEKRFPAGRSRYTQRKKLYTTFFRHQGFYPPAAGIGGRESSIIQTQ